MCFYNDFNPAPLDLFRLDISTLAQHEYNVRSKQENYALALFR